jgi:hypothetical protein
MITGVAVEGSTPRCNLRPVECGFIIEFELLPLQGIAFSRTDLLGTSQVVGKEKPVSDFARGIARSPNVSAFEMLLDRKTGRCLVCACACACADMAFSLIKCGARSRRCLVLVPSTESTRLRTKSAVFC